jgi:hypothetical protein
MILGPATSIINTKMLAPKQSTRFLNENNIQYHGLLVSRTRRVPVLGLLGLTYPITRAESPLSTTSKKTLIVRNKFENTLT